MTAPWTTLPDAAALLASLAADPPPKRGFKYDFSDYDIRYSDSRVSKLRRIWKLEQERLYDAGQYALWEVNAKYDEQAAIRDAIAAAPIKLKKVA